MSPLWSLKLVELDLSWNGIETLPDEVAKLTSLQILKLSGNQLSETSFPNLSPIPSMGSHEGYLGTRPSLHLNDNNFKGFPESFFTLKGLQLLQMDGNDIRSLPKNLTDLTSLKVLFISYVVEPEEQREVEFPDLERVYICPDPHDELPVQLVLPSYLTDSDIERADCLSPLVKASFSIPPGPSRRKSAFSQMLGSCLSIL